MKTANHSPFLRTFALLTRLDMRDSIEILRPAMLIELVQNAPNIYVREDFGFLNGISVHISPLVEKMKTAPQYVEVGRLIRITSGNAVFRINLVPVDLQAGDVMVIPENSYIEVNELSADFDVQLVSFKELPVSFTRFTHLRLSEADFKRTGAYLDLIWQVIHKPNFSMQTVVYLMSALMNDLQHLYTLDEQGRHIRTRSEKLMQQFVDLVAEYGATQRSVKFYADKMSLTTNYLSSFIRKQTNKSVMQWVAERTILQAQVLLRHTNESIGDIAFRLNFSEVTLFSRFFRRYTGMRPKDYRADG